MVKDRDALRNTLTKEPDPEIQPPGRPAQATPMRKPDHRESYQSEWARTMSQELRDAALSGDTRKTRENQKPRNTPDIQPAGRLNKIHDISDIRETRDTRDIRETKDNSVPDTWEQLIPKNPKPKIRIPPKITQWFGIDTDTDTTEDTDDNENEWNEVEYKKRNELKKKKQKIKNKNLQESIARRAANMIGIGPINLEKLSNYKKDNMTYENSKIEVVKDFLASQLAYVCYFGLTAILKFIS